MATTRWGGLRLEPYNPNAVDADGDGIVQEGTAWERPGGTRLIDELGREIRTGITSAQRPAKMRVQRDGKDVDYTPTYGAGTATPQAPEGKPTALANAGAPSLKEMGLPTLKSMLGTIGEPLPPPTLTSEQIQTGWDILGRVDRRLLGQLSRQDLIEASNFQRMLKKALTKVDEPEERLRISNMLFNSFYWGTTAFNRSGGQIGAVINDIWYSAQDAGFSPHEVLEEMWRAGGAFALTIPILRAKEKFKLTKKQTSEFASGVREYMRQKQIQAGQFNEKFKNNIRSVFKSLREDNNIPGLEFDFDGMSSAMNFSVNSPMMPTFASQSVIPRETPEPPKQPEPPKYPRTPPAAAFTGKAAEIFGNAKSWDEFRQLMDDNEIIFLDYETTGLEEGPLGQVTSNGLPTQIGAVRMKGGEVLDRFNVYINPGRPHAEWTQWSQNNLKDENGNLITQEFLEDKPDIAQAHRMLVDWIGEDVIMGAQNVIFDEEVLTRSLQESRIDWKPAGWLDTKEIADMALPRWSEDNQDAPFKVDADGKKSPSNRLSDITRYLGVDLGANHHTADHDAVASGEVLNRIVRGGIEKGWSPDVLDPQKRDAKEQKNKDDFEQAVSEFKKQVSEYNKSVGPSWVDLESIIDFPALGITERDEWSLDSVWQEATDDWNDWDPCREMRLEAYRLAGLAIGPADPNITRTGGYWGNGASPRQPGDPDKRSEQAKYLMGSLAEAVHKSPMSDRPTLYRAMDLTPEDAEAFLNAVQPGSEIDIPLLAFADRRKQGNNEFLSDYGKSVLIVLDDSPGSVEAGYFSPMWSDDDEKNTLDMFSGLVDDLEADEDEDVDFSTATEIRELLDEYQVVAEQDAVRRQELRDQLTDIAEEFGLSATWAGGDIDGDDVFQYENSPVHSPRERISGGRMEVVSVSDDPLGVYGRVVRLRQVGVFDPEVPGRLIKRRL